MTAAWWPNRPSLVHHRQFLRDKIQVVAATVAFGMGIDKPDIRLVVHYGVPKTVEDYYQHTGRAGRDGAPSRCECLYSAKDFNTQQFLIRVSAHSRLHPPPVSCGVGTGSMVLATAVAAPWSPGLVLTPSPRHTLACPCPPQDVTGTYREHLEAAMRCLREFVDTTGCRRRYLLAYFGEHGPAVPAGAAATAPSCHSCDNCVLRDKRLAAGESADSMERDFTDDARVLAKAVQELRESCGQGTVLKVLLGSMVRCDTVAARLRSRHLHRDTTHALPPSLSWAYVLASGCQHQALLAAGLLREGSWPLNCVVEGVRAAGDADGRDQVRG